MASLAFRNNLDLFGLVMMRKAEAEAEHQTEESQPEPPFSYPCSLAWTPRRGPLGIVFTVLAVLAISISQ